MILHLHTWQEEFTLGVPELSQLGGEVVSKSTARSLTLSALFLKALTCCPLDTLLCSVPNLTNTYHV